MAVIRKIVARGGGNCVAIPTRLLEFAGLKLGGRCTIVATTKGTIEIRRVIPEDLDNELDMFSTSLQGSAHAQP